MKNLLQSFLILTIILLATADFIFLAKDKTFFSKTPVIGTLNWKSYSDSAYGFSFKYPNNWTVETSEGDNKASLKSIILKSKPDESVKQKLKGTINETDESDEQKLMASIYVVSVNVYSTEFEDDYKTFLNEAETKYSFKIQSQDQATVDGVSGHKVIILAKGSPPVKQTWVYLPLKKSNANSIHVSFTMFENSNPAIFDQILSTFKFL